MQVTFTSKNIVFSVPSATGETAQNAAKFIEQKLRTKMPSIGFKKFTFDKQTQIGSFDVDDSAVNGTIGVIKEHIAPTVGAVIDVLVG
jgi:hypothetical protein